MGAMAAAAAPVVVVVNTDDEGIAESSGSKAQGDEYEPMNVGYPSRREKNYYNLCLIRFLRIVGISVVRQPDRCNETFSRSEERK